VQEVTGADDTLRMLAVFWPTVTDVGYIMARADFSVVSMTPGAPS
jgi:hypothetical protein